MFVFLKTNFYCSYSAKPQLLMGCLCFYPLCEAMLGYNNQKISYRSNYRINFKYIDKIHLYL